MSKHIHPEIEHRYYYNETRVASANMLAVEYDNHPTANTLRKWLKAKSAPKPIFVTEHVEFFDHAEAVAFIEMVLKMRAISIEMGLPVRGRPSKRDKAVRESLGE